MNAPSGMPTSAARCPIRPATASIASARRPGDSDWRLVGTIQLVAPREFDFKWHWHATLDQQGIMRFVVGEVPYDRTADAREFLSRTGSILERRLDVEDSQITGFIDPFDGTH